MSRLSHTQLGFGLLFCVVMTWTVNGPSKLRGSGQAINKNGKHIIYQHKEFRLKQEACGPHRSPEKPALVRSNDYIIMLIMRGEPINPKQTNKGEEKTNQPLFYN